MAGRWWGTVLGVGAAAWMGLAAAARPVVAQMAGASNPADPVAPIPQPAARPPQAADPVPSSNVSTGSIPAGGDTGPVVRSIFDSTDSQDDDPVQNADPDVHSSFDREDTVNDHPVP